MTPPPDPLPNRCTRIFVHYDLPTGAMEPVESTLGTQPLESFPGIIAETMVKQWEWVDLHFERPFPDWPGSTVHRIRSVQVDERERAHALRQRRRRQGG